MLIPWPLAVRWIHGALVADALRGAAVAVGDVTGTRPRWSMWARILRRVAIALYGEPERTGPGARAGRREPLISASRASTSLIGRVGAPLNRRLYRLTRGRLPFVGSSRVLLLTVVGRRSGRLRTTPLFYLRDEKRLVVCNVRPPGERSNPWVANVRAAGRVTVEIGGQRREVHAREADAEEVARYWPRFVRLWQTYERDFEATGERTLFVLEPTEAS